MITLTPRQLSNFFKKISKLPNGCWDWLGSKSSRGYGRFHVYPKPQRASKVSYTIFKGEVPDDKFVCHSCDNPSCVNPDHLWLGSPKENTHDMINKGRTVRYRSKHKDSASKYSGISFRKEKKSNPWRARIMRNYQTIWCEEFSSEEEANAARTLKMKELSTVK